MDHTRINRAYLVRLIPVLLSAFLFIQLLSRHFEQAEQTYFLQARGGDTSLDAWTNAVILPADPFLPRDFHPWLYLPGPENSGINTPRGLTALLPAMPSGYLLNIALSTDSGLHLPTLEIAVNGRIIDSIDMPPGSRDAMRAFHSTEIVIPPELVTNRENTLLIQCIKGAGPDLHVALMMNPFERRLLQFLLPCSGWLLLALALRYSKQTGFNAFFSILITVTFFGIYVSSRHVRALAPVNGFFFSDAEDLLDPLLKGAFTFDMLKHPLFLPIMQGINKVVGVFTETPAETLGAAFAIIGALSTATAFLWLNDWLGRPRLAAWVTVVLGFSFAPWAYSANYETYMLTALFVNLFILTLLRLRASASTLRILMTVCLLSAVILLHPPLAVLSAPFAAALFTFSNPWKKAVLRPIAAILIVFVLTASGHRLILHAYSNQFEASWQFDLTEKEQLSSTPTAIRSLKDAVRLYASSDNTSFKNLGRAMIGQAIHSVVGQPAPFDWTADRAAYRKAIHPASVTALILLVSAFVLGAVGGLTRPFGRVTTLLAGLSAGMVYLLFFWVVNPGEMLLYSAPLVPLVLGWFAKAADSRYPEFTPTLWGALSFAVFLANLLAIRTYV